MWSDVLRLEKVILHSGRRKKSTKLTSCVCDLHSHPVAWWEISCMWGRLVNLLAVLLLFLCPTKNSPYFLTSRLAHKSYAAKYLKRREMRQIRLFLRFGGKNAFFWQSAPHLRVCVKSFQAGNDKQVPVYTYMPKVIRHKNYLISF